MLLIILFGGIWTDTASVVFENTLSFITQYLGWYYILIVFIFLAFVIWLCLRPYGRIRLGKEHERPEFGKFAWFTMLFAAGMGMGLIFYGVAEPIMHYHDPPIGEPGTLEALEQAMRFSFMHWGFHPWAIYIIFGAAIAYFHFRIGLPLAPRSLLYPLFGERIHGILGHVVDAFCTVGTASGGGYFTWPWSYADQFCSQFSIGSGPEQGHADPDHYDHYGCGRDFYHIRHR